MNIPKHDYDFTEYYSEFVNNEWEKKPENTTTKEIVKEMLVNEIEIDGLQTDNCCHYSDYWDEYSQVLIIKLTDYFYVCLDIQVSGYYEINKNYYVYESLEIVNYKETQLPAVD